MTQSFPIANHLGSHFAVIFLPIILKYFIATMVTVTVVAIKNLTL